MLRLDYFGYYENKTERTPTHDPGLNGFCPICSKQISSPFDVKCIISPLNTKIYFTRFHISCMDRVTEQEISAIMRSSCLND